MIVQHATRRDWLEARLSGIGGSDAPAVLGKSPYATPYSVWADRVFPTPVDESEIKGTPMYFGLRLERAIAEAACDMRGWTLIDLRAPGAFCASVVVDAEPHLRSTPDFLVRDAAGRLGVLQIKNVDISKRDEWSDGVGPVEYEIQVQHEGMTCLTLEETPKFVALAALIGGNQSAIIERELDTPFLSAWLDQAAAFWRCVELKTPPPVDGRFETLRAAKRVWIERAKAIRANGQMLTLGPEFVDLMAQRERATAAKKAAEQIAAEADARALEAMAGHDEAIIPGAGRVKIVSVKEHTKPPVKVESYSYPRWSSRS